MSETKLHQSLEKMHEELNKVSSLDDESKKILLQLSDDIKNLLAKSEKTEGSVEEEKDDLISSLKDSAANFESEHPDLAESIHLVIHTLSNMGI
jgi:small-conductance mechanosensitive channel